MNNKTLNLCGQVFNFDEAGYTLLKSYLQELEYALVGNNDKLEIIEDVKSRIAENLQDKKSQVITKLDITELKTKIGNFEEYQELEESNTAGTSEKLKKNWKKGCIIIFLILLTLLLSCCFLTRASAGQISKNNPFSWFYKTADGMTSWFYNKSDEMTNRFDNKSDEMTKKYDEDTKKMQQDYQNDKEKMQQDFQNDQEKIQQDFQNQINNVTITPIR
ncbi:MAG: hypothetical protein WCJ58_03010 [bacterium]